jgi:CRISPR-associated endonuclease Cas1
MRTRGYARSSSGNDRPAHPKGAIVTLDEGSPLSGDDIVEAAAARSTVYAESTLGEVVIVDGYGVAVGVHRGCLELADGVGQDRRLRTISRADAGRTVKRIVVLGVGSITTEAARWCAEQGLPLVLAKPGGAEPFMIGAAALFDHGGLRRAQALAPFTPVAQKVVRWLLDLRLADQARIAEKYLGRGDAARVIDALREALAETESVSEAMTIEARAADGYWEVWESVEARFARRDLSRVPEHWRRFSGRNSPLSQQQSNRHAADAVNGLLNFGYWIGQSEATTALLALGLDPSMGVGHATRQSRPAAALDLMEACRGTIEETVIALLRDRTFVKRDFVESASGEIRLTAPLSHEVARVLSPRIRDRLAPVVEQMASMISEGADVDRVTVPTPLSGASRGKIRARRSTRFARHCHGCGQRLPEGLQHRSYCDECLPEARKERDLSEVGTARRRTRPPRRDYATSSAELRAETMRGRVAEQQAWERENRGTRRPDPLEFAPIREGLDGVLLDRIAQAIGVSRTAAGNIRNGRLVPHIRHWPTLAELAGLTTLDGRWSDNARSIKAEEGS